MKEDMQLYCLIVIIQDNNILLLYKSIKDFLVGSENRYLISKPVAYTSFVYRYINYLIS